MLVSCQRESLEKNVEKQRKMYMYERLRSRKRDRMKKFATKYMLFYILS